MARRKAKLWHYRRMIGLEECPHLQTSEKQEIRDALVDKYGVNSSFVASMIYGRFRRKTDENNVFTDHDLEFVMRAMSGYVEPIGYEMKAGLELSGGGDEQVLYVLRGSAVIRAEAWRMEDTDQLAELVTGELSTLGVEPGMCYVDNGGLGKAVIDNMEGRGFQPIYRYMSNQEPANRVEYADRVTEDHYRFKQLLKDYPIVLPKDAEMLQDMRQRRFVIDDHNRVKLEPKPRHRKRTLKSPDRLDAIVMAFSDWLPPATEDVDEEQEYQEKYGKYQRMVKEKQSGAFGGLMPQEKVW